MTKGFLGIRATCSPHLQPAVCIVERSVDASGQASFTTYWKIQCSTPEGRHSDSLSQLPIWSCDKNVGHWRQKLSLAGAESARLSAKKIQDKRISRPMVSFNTATALHSSPTPHIRPSIPQISRIIPPICPEGQTRPAPTCPWRTAPLPHTSPRQRMSLPMTGSRVRRTKRTRRSLSSASEL